RGLAGDERDDLEVRRTPLAGNGLATEDLEPAAGGELLQLLLAEAQVDVPVRLDHRAVLVAGQAGEQQPSTRAQHPRGFGHRAGGRSEEHTSELQSRENLVCR